MSTRKFDIGKPARLNKQIMANIPGIPGLSLYGEYGQEVQVMQFDPSKDKQYGVRKPKENFWRVSVSEDDLMPFEGYVAPPELAQL